jgi:hypothetical protein
MARSNEENRVYMKHWHIKKRQEIYEYKEKTPCADCGNSFPHYVMDFDHVRGEKLFNVSSAVSRRINKTTLWEEIAKCEIVCANCHRIRTHKSRTIEDGS